MLPAYEDIRSRIKEQPIWFDDNGVPRYEPFHPKLVGVYGRYVALLQIQCQSCLKKFLVSCEIDMMGTFMLLGKKRERPLALPDPKNGQMGDFGWHDPPRHSTGSLCAGETMSCDELGVVEFWIRDETTHNEWERKSQHEGILICEEEEV